MKLRVLTILIIGFVLFHTRNLGAQETESSLDIRVEAHEVVVPVFVFVKKSVPISTGANIVNHSLSISTIEADEQLLDLKPADFEVFEDGIRQEIRSMVVDPLPQWDVLDNISLHVEHSCSPSNLWIGPDIPKKLWRIFSGHFVHIYQISYVPPSSAQGSCHKLRVTVHQHEAQVFMFRDGYCKASGSLANTFSDAIVEKDFLEREGTDNEKVLPVSLQAGHFFEADGTNIEEIAIEFPWKKLRRHWSGRYPYTDLGIIGSVYDSRDKLVRRFRASTCALKGWKFCSFCTTDKEALLRDSMPTAFETQLRLPSGKYRVEISLHDDKRFGTAGASFEIEKREPNELGIGTPILCKRFHDVIARPSQYFALTAKGHQFQPAGDTRLHKGDVLFAFFDVYEPLLSDSKTKVNFQLKLTDVKTGEVKADTGLKAADEWINPGTRLIPIEQQIAIEKLPPGSYRVQVRASDSAGGTTAWHEAEFSVLPD